MTEIPLDLSKLSRKDLEKISLANNLPLEITDEAHMLFDLSDPEGMLGPGEGEDLSKHWTLNVSPNVHSNILKVLED